MRCRRCGVRFKETGVLLQPLCKIYAESEEANIIGILIREKCAETQYFLCKKCWIKFLEWMEGEER